MSSARLERNAKATFSVYEAGDVGIDVHQERTRAGVLWKLHSLKLPSRGLNPLSRYGDRDDLSAASILPSVLPAAHLHAPGGLHRFEPVCCAESLPRGAICLPDKEFRSNLLPLHHPLIGLAERADHFCRPPHVAMRYGLYLHP
jgi:hypothetical protein